MLTKPKYGWTDFHLDGAGTYALSYLDDIAFEWVDQAIHGLETMQPFCVKGFLEPDRLICTVSYWNCHIVVEDDDREPLEKADLINEFSHTSMLEFCRFLYEDIRSNLEDWASFVDHYSESTQQKQELLAKKLQTLHILILKNESRFGPTRCFL